MPKAFAQALKRAKLPGFRLYDLRHTFASLLLAQNAPITYVSAQLGHTDATTTLRWYARWLPRTDRHAEAEDESGAPDDSEAPDSSGGPSGTRTPDPLIKSQLLCQLS